MAATCSEGGGVEVDSGNMTMTKRLRKRTAATCSEARVEAAACSGAGDEAAVCSGAENKDSRWQRRCGSF
jgi:hypothetical protein